jgi:hypothetical protein
MKGYTMEISEEELKKKIDEAIAESKKGMFNQEQLNEIVAKRLGEANDKHKKELEEREKIAKMSAEEKQKHDFEVITKERDEFKTKLAERDHKDKILGLMTEKKIDSSLYDIFSNMNDLDKAGQMMDKYNETLASSVSAEVDKKIKPNVPNANGNITDDAQLRRAMGLN